MTPFQANVAVVLLGVGVMPGHDVYADTAGAVVVPAARLEDVLSEAREVAEEDAGFRDQIARAGAATLTTDRGER